MKMLDIKLSSDGSVSKGSHLRYIIPGQPVNSIPGQGIVYHSRISEMSALSLFPQNLSSGFSTRIGVHISPDILGPLIRYVKFSELAYIKSPCIYVAVH